MRYPDSQGYAGVECDVAVGDLGGVNVGVRAGGVGVILCGQGKAVLSEPAFSTPQAVWARSLSISMVVTFLAPSRWASSTARYPVAVPISRTS